MNLAQEMKSNADFVNNKIMHERDIVSKHLEIFIQDISALSKRGEYQISYTTILNEEEAKNIVMQLAMKGFWVTVNRSKENQIKLLIRWG